MTSPATSANPSLPSFTGPSIAIGKSSDSICDAVEADGIRHTSRLTASQASSPPAPRQVETKPKTVVELRNVCKTYLIGEHAVAALRGVSLTVSRGEFVLIYGKSGSGKSTLLSIMGTVDLATKGDVSVLGTRVSARTKDDILAQLRLTQVGFMFQSFNLLQVSSARENVLLPMRLAGRLGWRERGRRADYLLEKVGMEDRKGSRPSQLSGGEQQRVTIARALANEPQVLLMDEPTGDLDGVSADRVMEMLVDLHDEGRTLVMVTHDRRLRGLADRVLYVCDGLISHEEVVAEEVKRGIRGALRERNARRK